MAGVVGVGCCCLRLAVRLTEVCGPGMPGPYWVVKEKQSATGRNPSGAAAPPPFDKGGRGRAQSALIVHQERTLMMCVI